MKNCERQEDRSHTDEIARPLAAPPEVPQDSCLLKLAAVQGRRQRNNYDIHDTLGLVCLDHRLQRHLHSPAASSLFS